jgi:hypothetical protein
MLLTLLPSCSYCYAAAATACICTSHSAGPQLTPAAAGLTANAPHHHVVGWLLKAAPGHSVKTSRAAAGYVAAIRPSRYSQTVLLQLGHHTELKFCCYAHAVLLQPALNAASRLCCHPQAALLQPKPCCCTAVWPSCGDQSWL